ncbi:carbonyl reductase 1 [Microdochium nivale]|nr:carbonyl reductase 1 [Microdochium nivale]
MTSASPTSNNSVPTPDPIDGSQTREFQDSDVLLLQQENNLQQQQPPRYSIEQQLSVSRAWAADVAAEEAEEERRDNGGRTPGRRGPGSGTAQLTAYDRSRARTLYFDAGRSMKEIARITGYSLSQVRTAIKRAVPGRRPGRPRKDGANYAPEARAAAAAAAAAVATTSTSERAAQRRRGGPILPIPWPQTPTFAVEPSALLSLVWPAVGNQPSDDSSDDLISDDEDDNNDDVDGEDADGSAGIDLDGTRQAISARPRGVPHNDQSQPVDNDSAPVTRIDPTKTIVLVTSASSGVGHGIVTALCLAFCPSITARPSSGGPYHIFLADRSYHRARDAARGMTCHHGNTVSPLQLDTHNPRSVMDAARVIHETAGRVDVLVLNNGDPGSAAAGAGAGKDPVSILRHTLETHLVSSYAVSEGLKWLLMAQPAPRPAPEHDGQAFSPPLPPLSAEQIAALPPSRRPPVAQVLHKTKRLIHVTSTLSSISVQHQETHSLHQHNHNHSHNTGIANPAAAAAAAAGAAAAGPSAPALAEYRMSLAALNMLAACQASAAHAAGVRVGVWNSGAVLHDSRHHRPSGSQQQQQQGPQQGGSGRARVSAAEQERCLEAGRAFVKVVGGERDGDFAGLMDTHGGWVPW